MKKFLKVLIVDDEYLIRELLKNSIDWENYGMRVIADTSGAMEAMEIVENNMPDIIFVDICMPFIDGIEFSKNVLSIHPDIKIIILTGHQNFDYARRSIKIGVYDFLSKPINVEEIIIVINKVKAKIEKEHNLIDEYNILKKRLEENFPYLKEKFLNDLLKGKLETEEVKRKLDYFRVNLKEDAIQAAVVEVEFFEKEKNIVEEEKLILKLNSIDNITKYLESNKKIIVFMEAGERIAIICNDKVISLTEECENIRTRISNKLKCSVSIGIGNQYEGIQNISASYYEAATALEYKIIEGKNNVIHYNDITRFEKGKQAYIENDLKSIEFYLRGGIASEAKKILKKIFVESNPGVGTSVETIRIIASSIISTILNSLVIMGIPSSNIFKEELQPYEKVFVIETIPEMLKYLSDLIETTSDEINKLNIKKTNRLMTDIKNWVKENIADFDLTLSKAARAFLLNPSYLSRKFKKETGETFVEYISRIRLNKALNFLKETDLKNYEISEKIGIADPHYFSIFFKKHMNMSVSDYKKEIEGRNK